MVDRLFMFERQLFAQSFFFLLTIKLFLFFLFFVPLFAFAFAFFSVFQFRSRYPKYVPDKVRDPVYFSDSFYFHEILAKSCVQVNMDCPHLTVTVPKCISFILILGLILMFNYCPIHFAYLLFRQLIALRHEISMLLCNQFKVYFGRVRFILVLC